MKRYIVSAEAGADLDEIWDYIAGRSSPETASEFLWRFHGVFATLAHSPSAGVAVPELQAQRVRKFPMGNYLVYYRADRATITIWRILHGKRIQLRALRPHPRP